LGRLRPVHSQPVAPLAGDVTPGFQVVTRVGVVALIGRLFTVWKGLSMLIAAVPGGTKVCSAAAVTRDGQSPCRNSSGTLRTGQVVASEEPAMIPQAWLSPRQDGQSSIS
jgi:hypothetical protein